MYGFLYANLICQLRRCARAGTNVFHVFFRHPTTGTSTGRFFLNNVSLHANTPPASPTSAACAHGAEQHERTAWTSDHRFRSRSFRRCFTSPARRSARRSRSRLRACSIAFAVACSSRNRRCSAQRHQNSKRPCRCCCCCSSCCCCSGCCCSSCFCCCCCTHPTETSKYSTTTRSAASKHSSSTYESIRAAASDAILTLSSDSSPCERRGIGGAGGATTPVARVRSRSTSHGGSSNRSWTRGSWSAPRIFQLQRVSAVPLRFLLRFLAFSQKEQTGPFLTFSWRFQKFFNQLFAAPFWHSHDHTPGGGLRSRLGGGSHARNRGFGSVSLMKLDCKWHFSFLGRSTLPRKWLAKNNHQNFCQNNKGKW